MKIKLQKIEDSVFNGVHPNDINVGFEITEDVNQLELPVVGYSFYLGTLRTSKVTEILAGGVFRTKNSIYKLTFE